jgi:protein-S-isoprenylcysteine O-methyltransferase Ste14
MQWYRAKQEQAALAKVHGKEYIDYLDQVMV